MNNAIHHRAHQTPQPPPKMSPRTPAAVRRAIQILLVALAITCARQIVVITQKSHLNIPGCSEIVGSALLVDALALVLIYNLYRCRNWARIALIVGALWGMLFTFTSFRMDALLIRETKNYAPPILWSAATLAQVVAILLLAAKSSNAWFRKGRGFEPEAPSPVSTPPHLPSAEYKWLNATTVLSILSFVLAMTQPAFYENAVYDKAPNSALLLSIGWMGILVGYMEWVANPLIFVSWALARQGRFIPGMICALLAVAFIVGFMHRTEMVWPSDAGDRHATIQRYGLGYWGWLTSAALMVISLGVAWLVDGSRRGVLRRPNSPP